MFVITQLPSLNTVHLWVPRYRGHYKHALEYNIDSGCKMKYKTLYFLFWIKTDTSGNNTDEESASGPSATTK